jgi:hypothetical protein
MDNLNSQENDIDIEDIGNQKDSKKRVSYVSRDHSSMVEFVSVVYKNLGHAEYHSNKAIATVHGLSPDSIKQHLTSAQQYKLIEIKHGVGYKISPLFNSIYLPKTDAEKRSAVIESLKSPETYQQLFKEYEYHIVPPLNGIKNYFIRTYVFKAEVAEKAAQIFLQNLKDYELLDARGVLISAMPLKPTVNVHEVEVNETLSAKDNLVEVLEKKPSVTSNRQIDNDELFELPIPLPNRRRAYLRYPVDNLTRKDINVITKALEFIASSLEDD